MNPAPRKKEKSTKEFAYPISEQIVLPKPVASLPVKSFVDVINGRKSTKIFRELNLSEISNILWISAKVKALSVQDNGYILTYRSAPSAGARHPIDIVLQFEKNNELFYYNPFDHSINKLRINFRIANALNIHTRKILNTKLGMMVWFIAHEGRTAAKYINHKSLVWRDAGACIYCFQLTCAALGVNSCPVGTLGEPYLSKAFQKFGKVYGVGGIMIG